MSLVVKRGLKLLMVFVIGIAVWQYTQESHQSTLAFEQRRVVLTPIEDIVELDIESSGLNLQVRRSGEKWVLPSLYGLAANQGRVEMTLKMMSKIHSDQKLSEEKPEFLFNEPMGKVSVGSLEVSETFVIGGRQGPRETLYVKKIETGDLFAVHKYWAQWLQGGTMQWLSPNLSLHFASAKTFGYRSLLNSKNPKKLAKFKNSESPFQQRELSPELRRQLAKVNVAWEPSLSDCVWDQAFHIRIYTNSKKEGDPVDLFANFNQNRICLAQYRLEGMVNPIEFNRFWKLISAAGA